MAECSIAELIDQACENQFSCLQDERTFRAVLLQLVCNLSQAVAPATFTSAEIPLEAVTTNYAVNHGLGATPRFIRAVFVCIANDADLGTVIGDEIEVLMFFNGDVATNPELGFQIISNSTQIIVASVGDLVGNEANWRTVVKAGSGENSPTSFNNFRLRIYATL